MEHAQIALVPPRDATKPPPNSGSYFDLRISAFCVIVKTHWIQEGRSLLQAAYDLARKQAAGTFALRCATSLYRHSPPERCIALRNGVLKALDAVEYREDVADVADATSVL
ncbi:hypothetical protein AXG93_4609s1000 [Marchantia polymorpha subsp. ruderalis]|uniref:Uncharacterized protein n=1 Tax=Marchantia polymorpha subsp. ruderalis TaxID=1480154 RepID=A0A176VPP0_MARPO|nr:hypothetical protein AXG93_4609s1000 [Marchantia polymorpha subsp. ruderalis]